MVGAWNALPSKVVEANMLGSFKTYLDSHMNRLGIEGYKRMVELGTHDRCGLGGPKGLFLCCNFLCSLFFCSFHPKHIKEAIPYGQALRIHRICSDEEDHNRHLQTLKDALIRTG